MFLYPYTSTSSCNILLCTYGRLLNPTQWLLFHGLVCRKNRSEPTLHVNDCNDFKQTYAHTHKQTNRYVDHHVRSSKTYCNLKNYDERVPQWAILRVSWILSAHDVLRSCGARKDDEWSSAIYQKSKETNLNCLLLWLLFAWFPKIVLNSFYGLATFTGWRPCDPPRSEFTQDRDQADVDADFA